MPTTTYPGCTQCCDPGVATACCVANIPSTLHSTITGWISASVTLVWNGSTFWTGRFDLCGSCTNYELQVRCNAGTWQSRTLSGGGASCDLCESSYEAADSATCSPLDLVFSLTNANASCPCGTGTLDIHVTA